MKKIILLTICSTFFIQSFAGHYKQQGNIDREESTFQITDLRLSTVLKTPKPYFEFESDCSGIVTKDNAYNKANCNEFLSASGRTHKISDLFKTYERRALSMGENTHHFVSSHDTDVFVVFDKKGKDYTIDIYTGEDALEMKATLSK